VATPTDLDPVLAELGARLRAALTTAGLPDTDPGFERPKDPSHGDWASTLSLRLAKPAKQNPRAIAQAVVDAVALPSAVASVEIAGPGFLNFRFGPSYWRDIALAVLAAGDTWGRRTVADAQRVNVEFVSANPTGPLHAGAGRWCATGDAIAELLASQGHTVEREYYVNDAGEQIRVFGETVVLVHAGQPLGENHYQGDYIADLVSDLVAAHGEAVFSGPAGVEDTGTPELLSDGVMRDDAGNLVIPGSHDEDVPAVDAIIAARVGVLAVEAMRARIEATVEGMGVHYDTWFSERENLHESGAIDRVVTLLGARGMTYEQDDALFLRTTDHGDDKDRVLVRGDGRPTYFAADCAYMQSKAERADQLWYLLGADHHGYVGRLKAVAGSLGIAPARVEIRIGQLVNLLRDGVPVKMSKRAGEFVTLDEVVEEVGIDVARYHFLRSSLDTTVDFDMAKVVEQSTENPVFYVQYAHARVAQLIAKADERGFDHGTAEADLDAVLLTQPAEVELLRGMAALPGVVAEAAELRATQRLTRFIEDYAAQFHRFYAESRILSDEAIAGDPDAVALSRSRYWLAVAAKQVLGNALSLLRVSAPDLMERDDDAAREVA
jgi:arginyl-tRNA synthetase